VLFVMWPLIVSAHAANEQCRNWPGWEQFKRLYLSEDGRVVDAGTPQAITVSEGQGYALTFALIANDPAAFEKILHWTRDNLAGGDLARSLPAWEWGRAEGGHWRILDPNAAADADLWMAYALMEAGNLWRNAAYAQLGDALSELILREEVAVIPGLGSTVLPGPKGFVTQAAWRLNASYMPVQILRAVHHHSGDRRWADVLDSSVKVIVESAPHGYAADWIQYRQSGGFCADPVTHGAGSYDAIRVYLWTGMLPEDDPQGALLVRKLAPMAVAASLHLPPESIDTQTLEAHGQAPLGFQAALLPLLVRLKYTGAAETYRKRIAAESLQNNQHYYGDALSLFGVGWIEGRFRFDRHGDLRVSWTRPCPAD
jgi:endo-1,4-beta-D-glucanase Y